MTEEERKYYREYARKWRAAHREYHNRKQRERRAANPEQTAADRRKAYLKRKPLDLAATKEWHRKNPERAREIHAKSRAKHSAKHVARAKKWRLEHPEEYKILSREAANRRRARKKNSTIGKIDYTEVQYRTYGCCGICGEPVGPDFHYDHVIPISKGGSHTTDNLQLSHPSCNVRKSAKLVA